MFSGFHASTVSEYANAFAKALSLSKQELVALRKRARMSSGRFGEDEFVRGWIKHVEKLVTLNVSPPSASEPGSNEIWAKATVPLFVALTVYDLWNSWNAKGWISLH